MGLLDELNLNDSDRSNAFNTGLLSMGLSMLQKGGKPMQALGSGGLQGMQAYQQALEQAQAEKIQQYKMKQLQEELLRKKQQEMAQAEFVATLPPEMQKLAAAYPQMVPQLLSQEKKRHVVGNAMIDDNGNVLYQGQEKPQQAPALVQEIEAWRNMPEGPQKDLLGKILQSKAQGQQSQPYYTPIPTEQGLGSFNNRTGQFNMVGGGGIVKPSDSPALQAKIAGAKEDAKLGAESRSDARKAIKKSDQLLSIANKADALLDANPTGSGVGSAVDAAGRFFGVTSDSAKIASELETLSGWMVSNVPRMEGPQSNFDVKNYETMAAKVGDRTVPVTERKAALRVLVQLQEKYKHLNQDSAQADYSGAGALEPVGKKSSISTGGWSATVVK